MLIPDLASLLEAAKSYILSSVISRHDAFDDRQSSVGSNDDNGSLSASDNTLPPTLKRFRYLAEKMTNAVVVAGEAGHEEAGSTRKQRLIGQLNSYVADLKLHSHNSAGSQNRDSFHFWQERNNVYTELGQLRRTL